MKIQIKSGDHDFNLPLPTRLLFSRLVIKILLKNGKQALALESIPPYAVDKIVAEFKRIKKKYGIWELMDMQSVSGEHVKIIL